MLSEAIIKSVIAKIVVLEIDDDISLCFMVALVDAAAGCSYVAGGGQQFVKL